MTRLAGRPQLPAVPALAAPGGAEHPLGSLADIPVGEGRAFAVGEEQVAVFRLRRSHVRAVQAGCPHLGGPLADGQVDEHVVVCPLHANTGAKLRALNTRASSY